MARELHKKDKKYIVDVFVELEDLKPYVLVINVKKAAFLKKITQRKFYLTMILTMIHFWVTLLMVSKVYDLVFLVNKRVSVKTEFRRLKPTHFREAKFQTVSNDLAFDQKEINENEFENVDNSSFNMSSTIKPNNLLEELEEEKQEEFERPPREEDERKTRKSSSHSEKKSQRASRDGLEEVNEKVREEPRLGMTLENTLLKGRVVENTFEDGDESMVQLNAPH